MSGDNTGDTVIAALKETLERSGTLDNVRAQLRATILKCMDETLPKSDNSVKGLIPRKSSPPIENVLINEMIAEYLSFNGYKHTLSVFNLETKSLDSDMEGNALGESFIRTELGLHRRSNSKPLAMLYEVVFMLKARLRGVEESK